MSVFPNIILNTISQELQSLVSKLISRFKGFVIEPTYSLLDEIEFHLEIISIQNQHLLVDKKVYRSINDGCLLKALESFTFNGLLVTCGEEHWNPIEQSFAEFKRYSDSHKTIEITKFSKSPAAINIAETIKSL